MGIKESAHKPVLNTCKEAGACLAPGIFSNKLTEQESMDKCINQGYSNENPMCTGEEEPTWPCIGLRPPGGFLWTPQPLLQITHLVFGSHCLGNSLFNSTNFPFSTGWQALWGKGLCLKITRIITMATVVFAPCHSLYRFFCKYVISKSQMKVLFLFRA